MNNHYVYITTNTFNDKKYIGQRKCPKHITNPEKDSYLGSGNLLLKAIKKYGRDYFTKEIIASNLSQKEADILEGQIIKDNNAVVSEEFYNIFRGGQYWREDHGKVISEIINNKGKKWASERAILGRISKEKKRAKRNNATPNFTTIDEYYDYRKRILQLREQEKLIHKQEREKQITERELRKQKEREFKEWYKNTPIGKQEEYNSRRNASKKGWENARDNILKGMEARKPNRQFFKDNHREVTIARFKKKNNLAAIYLYDMGIHHMRTHLIDMHISRIGKSGNKRTSLYYHAEQIRMKCKKYYKVEIDVNHLISLLRKQHNIL